MPAKWKIRKPTRREYQRTVDMCNLTFGRCYDSYKKVEGLKPPYSCSSCQLAFDRKNETRVEKRIGEES